MPKSIGIIPCRMESSRLPGKPLALIHGVPMIEHVYRAACKSKLDRVVVATDSSEIQRVIQAIGGIVVRTRSDHRNGTTRIAEAAQTIQTFIGSADVIVDIQGDDPLVAPDRINSLIDDHIQSDHRSITVSVCAVSETCAANRNVVKVIEGYRNRVQTMTRSPNFPYEFRPGSIPVYRHLSTIAFSLLALQVFSAKPECPQELMEGIELLRAIYYDIPVYTHKSAYSPSVDTLEDLDYVRSIFPIQNP